MYQLSWHQHSFNVCVTFSYRSRALAQSSVILLLIVLDVTIFWHAFFDAKHFCITIQDTGSVKGIQKSIKFSVFSYYMTDESDCNKLAAGCRGFLSWKWQDDWCLAFARVEREREREREGKLTGLSLPTNIVVSKYSYVLTAWALHEIGTSSISVSF